MVLNSEFSCGIEDFYSFTLSFIKDCCFKCSRSVVSKKIPCFLDKYFFH